MSAGPRTVTFDVMLLHEIEGTFALDLAAHPDVIAALMKRADEADNGWIGADVEAALRADIAEALAPSWLELFEVSAFQRLRGWHRLRYGSITVPRDRLADVRRALNTIAMAISSECDTEIDELKDCDPPELYQRAIKSMADTGYCGECQWCTAVRLWERCEELLTNGANQ